MLFATSGSLPIEALYSSRSLVEDCVAGNLSAWRHLHRQYYDVVLAFLRRLGVRTADLDDTSQEVFLQLFRSLSQFRGHSELKTWLYRVCATQATRLRRRQALLEKLSIRVQTSTEQLSTNETTEGALLARSTLDRVLSELTERERLVFLLFEFEGLSGGEIAKIADCPVNTVWRRLFNARNRLKSAIEREESEYHFTSGEKRT
jgi:RNA polymerase sigma-70 factor (ECF subfamily)